MAKYLDMSAHYEVDLDEVLGAKKLQPKIQEKEKDTVDEVRKEEKRE